MRMSGILPLVLLLLAAASGSFSSTARGAPPHLGFQVGTNLTRFEYSDREYLPLDISSYKSRMTYQVGPVVHFSLSQVFYVEPGLIFNLKGNKIAHRRELPTLNDPLNPIRAHAVVLTDLYYLTLPLLFGVRFGPGPIRPTIAAGPELAYLITARESSETTGGGRTLSGSDTVTDWYPSTDIGLTLRGGLDFPAVRRQWSIRLGYTWGLTNLNATANGDVHHFFNRTFSILAGVWL